MIGLNKISNKHFVKYFFISIVLVVICLFSVFSYILTTDLSITTLSNFYSKNILKGPGIDKPLKKGQILKGEFTAKENNLGIIAIAFDPRFRTWDDIIFRVKEKGAKDWYFSNKFWALQFLDFEYFPFGFPLIKESKNKTYQFELKSLVAKEGEGVAIRKNFPTVIIKYQFNKNDLLTNKINLIRFFFKKILNNFYTPEFIFVFLVSFFPFLLYLIYLFKKSLSLKLLNIIPIIFLFWDIFLIRRIYGYLSFIILSLLFINLKKKKLFYLFLLLLFIMPLTNIFNFSYLQYKASYWFILILITAVVQNYFIKLFFRKRRVVIS